jgi:hypothetical protein
LIEDTKKRWFQKNFASVCLVKVQNLKKPRFERMKKRAAVEKE